MSAIANEVLPPQPGDPAPWFFAVGASNPRYNVASVAGRYVLLIFAGPAAIPSIREQIEPLRAAGLIDDLRATAMVIVPGPLPEKQVLDRLPGFRVLADPQGAIYRQYGLVRSTSQDKEATFGTAGFLLDPLLRVVSVFALERLGAACDLLQRLPPPHLHAGQETPAPVLLLPRVFEPGFCQRLLAYYGERGGEDSGYMMERDGKTVGVYDHEFKRRADCTIENAELQAQIRARVSRRIVPELRKAFQFDATRIERYIIACYEGGTRGHFRAHRDNTTPGTAHRRFAVTINLNDDFEGGELWFPEFGPRRYRPPAGGAVVFSCSLLHEATPVTGGIRYAVLPFLYDEAAAKVRQANAASLTPRTKPPLASTAAGA